MRTRGRVTTCNATTATTRDEGRHAAGRASAREDETLRADEREEARPIPARRCSRRGELEAGRERPAVAGTGAAGRGLEPPGASRSVSDERRGGEDQEYRWHTGLNRLTGVEDAVEFVDVHKAFGRNKILHGLNMGIPEGKISMILGPSGTGKSVCIKHMVGLLYPDQGDVLVHGESVPNMADDDLFETRKKFGVLFQDGALFGSMNLVDNVAFPLRQHTDKGEDEILEIVHRRLVEVGLQDAHDKMPNELSGGMRKRAASSARSSSTRTSCSSTSPTRAWTPCAPRCCASSSRRSTRRTAAPTWSSRTTS